MSYTSAWQCPFAVSIYVLEHCWPVSYCGVFLSPTAVRDTAIEHWQALL